MFDSSPFLQLRKERPLPGPLCAIHQTIGLMVMNRVDGRLLAGEPDLFIGKQDPREIAEMSPPVSGAPKTNSSEASSSRLALSCWSCGSCVTALQERRP